MTERERLLLESAEEAARAAQYGQWAASCASESVRGLWLDLAASKRHLAEELRGFADRLDGILKLFDRGA